jgi:hypothetical protein
LGHALPKRTFITERHYEHRSPLHPGCSALIATLLPSSGCGGGGDSDWLFPLWIPTDVWVGDIDRDTRADILTLASYSTGMDQQEGRLVVRRQTTPGVFASAQT